MKARQTMGNQALIQEVVSHLSQRFVPSIPIIKKVEFPRHNWIYPQSYNLQEIDNLLEKEYIKRVEESMDTFEYVAWYSKSSSHARFFW